jgi:translation initiation factor 4A
MAACDFDVTYDETKMTLPATAFEDMINCMPLLRGIYTCGYVTPSPIQQYAITPIVRGGDVIAQALSGTGKTAAFSTGSLQQMVDGAAATGATGAPRVLILGHTHELALQTCLVVNRLGRYMAAAVGGDAKTDTVDEVTGQLVRGPDSAGGGPAGYLARAFIGGTSLRDDYAALRNGVAVAVGTPGRLNDLVRRGAMDLTHVARLVIDEADEMLSEGYAEQISELFQFLPKAVSIAMFSATLNPDVMHLSKQFMVDPTTILLRTDNLSLAGINHYSVTVGAADDKAEVVRDLFESVSISQTIIFVDTCTRAEMLCGTLVDAGFVCKHVHSKMARQERQTVVQSFVDGLTRVLVSTDLLGRGLDSQHVRVVLQMDLPRTVEAYTHRVGRSGRYGRKGMSISIVTPDEAGQLGDFAKKYGFVVEALPSNFASMLEKAAVKPVEAPAEASAEEPAKAVESHPAEDAA